ncbi:hypothetical protein [Stenomitos frigidus]|uniref:HTH merR-type domain-containing protein n=1 Tax=Stenomitos frigidus ULC18 TaxID=2107698 RepID=A0A2T1DUA2_9CYAN|nr:hypothetical protein [Stenomitos frigidus]PSB24065.1 hypothetical protein C7B82_28395 [Stenomitos frigidus ULC18]
MAPQVIQANGHTLQELAWRLSTVRRKRVPIRTLRWWIEQLHMEPNEYGLYDDSDLALLISLVLFLKRCRSVAKFKTLLLQELETHAP